MSIDFCIFSVYTFVIKTTKGLYTTTTYILTMPERVDIEHKEKVIYMNGEIENKTLVIWNKKTFNKAGKIDKKYSIERAKAMLKQAKEEVIIAKKKVKDARDNIQKEKLTKLISQRMSYEDYLKSEIEKATNDGMDWKIQEE